MEPKFKKNSTIDIFPGGNAKVLDDKPLGSGGQGEVYRVSYKNEIYALKWYTSPSIINNEKFYDNLKKNALANTPSDNFLWPKYVTVVYP